MNDLTLAEYCGEAYQGIGNLYSKFIGKSQHKYVIEYPNTFVIVFRGSVNKQDWLDDFSFQTVDFYNTNVSIGFLSCLNEDKNRQLKYNKPIIICGHSLGGAVAQLHAFELALLGNNVSKVVTFGSPFVGAKSFQEAYDNLLKVNTFRYINGNDIVPKMPPIKFYHTGNQVNIGNKYKWFNPKYWIHLFIDHKISNYIKNIFWRF